MSFAEAQSILRKAYEDNVFTAAAAYVSICDRCVFFQAIGTLGGPGSPQVTSTTLFDLASLTKILATTMVWVLFASKDPSVLDVSISHWLGRVPEDKLEITPRLLLAHASGLPAWRPYYLMSSPEKPENFVVSKILSERLEYPVGKGTLYSDLGFMLLGRVLEAAYMTDFQTLCQKLLFTPLGLENDLTFNPNFEQQPTAWTSFEEPQGGMVNDLNCRAMGGLAGHAGLFGTAEGVTRMCRCFLKSLVSENGFFDHGTARIFAKRANISIGSTRALGFDTPSDADSSCGSYFSHSSLGHTGFTGTSVWMDADKQLVATLLTNRVIMGQTDQRIKGLRPLFYDAIMKEALGI